MKLNLALMKFTCISCFFTCYFQIYIQYNNSNSKSGKTVSKELNENSEH